MTKSQFGLIIFLNCTNIKILTVISPLKYPGTLLLFFARGGEIIRKEGYFSRQACTAFQISFFLWG